MFMVILTTKQKFNKACDAIMGNHTELGLMLHIPLHSC